MIYAEVSVAFDRIETLDGHVSPKIFRRKTVPWKATFRASKAFLGCRCRDGARSVPLPDFLIGAHAAVRGCTL